MKRMKLCLLILPLLAAGAAQAQDHRDERGGSRWATDAGRGQREQAQPRSDGGRRDDGRHGDDRRDESRHDDGRRSEPPRVWTSPPRNDGYRDHERREQTWNRDMYRRDYWRDNRGSNYGYNRYPNYYRDYDRNSRDRGYYGRGHDNRRHWSRGERLPYGYYDRSRWERDYWRYDLYDPRDGCGWVRSDGDALLVVLASGLVLDAVYDVFR